ncbi:hypothetical protein PRK78_006245 [Emydomyces testavorans]|uniref:Uncharacterized protein n=1 Tax=Emydomyces testavorans TaxID=2070801 RepID=A0AAF0DN58_9EURO|nr:hypothetical protein PRK78_006245 [Emydomyces testavorans]
MDPTRESNVERDADAHDMTLRKAQANDATSIATLAIRDDRGYRVYKRRFFGLAQLVLLNIVVSWDGGPKPSIVACAGCLLVGNWVRYAGTKANDGNFGVTMLGQIIIGFAQPFVLTAPTRYSDAWFNDRGRTSATALATLANPFGGALGQLIGPMWATNPDEVPNMVLYVSIISLLQLFRAREFWLIFFPFSVYVGLFNSSSSLLNQILQPHGFSETDAGITGALLIFVGLAAAAICSPIADRHKHHLGIVRILTPIVAATYIGFIFAPEAHSVAGPFVVAALLGASSFAILPVILEYLVEITYPMSPEIPSTICWVGGQILGAVFILVETALKAGPDAEPPRNMKQALIFQAVVASVVVPAPLCMGLFGTDVRKRRLEAEEQGREP